MVAKKTTTNNNLPIAIAFAAVLIAGAIFFNGMKSPAETDTNVDLDAKIAAGIEGYIKKQQEEARRAQEEANKPKKVEGVSADDDAILGDPDAPVTIVEFSDYECPFCKRNFQQVLPKIKEKYIDTGKVKYVFRDLPLPFHEPIATQEALAAECAGDMGGDSKYYEFHDELYRTTKSNKGLEQSQLYEIAEKVGLNAAEFKECLDTEKFKEEIEKDMADGASYGVTGTPGFFINGWFIKGAYPFAEFEKFIEQELAATK
jgi:protein-disulfide isomerase